MAPLITLAALALSGCRPARGFGTEVISDITAPAADEGRALNLKNEQFWRPILRATEVQDVQGHALLYADAEAVVAALPAENSYVRKTLGEALARLRRADAAVLAQAGQQADLASERLAAVPSGGQDHSSVYGGQGLLALALKRLSEFGGYFSRLRGHVQDRQADIIPALQGAVAATGGVLSDCRAASKSSFDVLKYDIYQRGVAKTPEAAKAVANRLVDASAETRRRFMKLVMTAVEGVTRDTTQQNDQPSAVVTRSLLEDMTPLMQPAKQGLFISLVKMDVLPLRVVATLAPPEAAACDNFFSLSAKSATEPLKIRLRGRSLAESSGDESETTATGARTPDTHASSAAAEPSSPAFVTQGSLETVTAVAAAPHARKLLDASAPAFVPEGPGWARSSAPGCGAGPAEGAAPRQPSKMLLVRNVPEWYTPEMLLEEIRDSGFRMHQDFDFFYMPQDCRLGLNPGYSMLSFRDEGAAKAFEAAFHKKTPRLTEHAPAFEVRPAPGKDWVKICSEVAASQAKRKEGSMGLAPSFPRQARYCPQCGSEADFARFNFCSQCGASLPQLRPRSLLG